MPFKSIKISARSPGDNLILVVVTGLFNNPPSLAIILNCLFAVKPKLFV